MVFALFLAWGSGTEGGFLGNGFGLEMMRRMSSRGRRLSFDGLKTCLFVAAALAFGMSRSHADDIGGTAKIEPRGGVVVLTGVTGAKILSIDVHEGQLVKRGQLLMTLDDRIAREDEQVAELTYIQSKRDAAQDIAASTVSLRIAAEHLKRTQADAAAYRELGPTATSEMAVEDREQAAHEALLNFNLDQSKDQQTRANSAASISSAAKHLDQAKQKLSDYRVVAPSDGTILRIDQHVGENLTGQPAMEMGDIRQMYVIAQIFQGDLLKIHPGMRVTVKNSAFKTPLKGTVDQVGRLIDTKAQLGDVRVKLDDPVTASKLVEMEVEVQIAR
jgi:multidrug resistance efflux pump